jgi:hypothetical protein
MAVKLLPAGTLPYDDDDRAAVQRWIADHKGGRIDPIDINRRGLLDIVTINFPVFFTNKPIAYARLNKTFFKGVANEDSFLRAFVAGASFIIHCFRVTGRWRHRGSVGAMMPKRLPSSTSGNLSTLTSAGGNC